MKTPGEIFAESNNRNLDEEYSLMSMFIVSRKSYDEGEFRRFIEEHAAPYDDYDDGYDDYEEPHGTFVLEF